MSPHLRHLPLRCATGPWNMAADEALLASAGEGTAALRFYTWDEPTLSLGYFQESAPARAYPHLGALAWLRRPSGGAALVHHREVTYALALPAGAAWQTPGQSWLVRLHEIIRDALAAVGARTHLCERERKPGEVLCFLHHTPGDLVMGDAKVVGSAQRKVRGAILQHGGILLDRSPHAPELPGINDLAGTALTPAAVEAAILPILAAATGWRIENGTWTPQEEEFADRQAGSRYADPAWNGRR